VVSSVPDVYRVRRRLQKSWTVVRERDYIAKPKDDDYRALHLVVRRASLSIEVQLRTRGQDLWANAIEEAGRQTGIEFKFGEGPENERTVLAGVAAMIAAIEEGKVSATELLAAGAIGAPRLPPSRSSGPAGPGYRIMVPAWDSAGAGRMAACRRQTSGCVSLLRQDEKCSSATPICAVSHAALF
jgi:hypothetical protein